MKNREKTAIMHDINTRRNIIQRMDLDASISRWRMMLVIVAVRQSYDVSTTSHHPNCCWQVDAFSSFSDIHSKRFYLEEKLLMAPSRSVTSFPTQLFANDLDDIDPSTSKPILSEVDAIKVLRAYPHPTKKHRITHENNTKQHLNESGSLIACKSAQDVLQILHQSSSLSHQPEWESGDKVEDIVNAVSPNIAAAALRRLLSPPFLPVSFSTTKKGIQYLSKQQIHQNDVNESERDLYIKLKTLLEKNIRDNVELQAESLSHFTNSDTASTSTLLPKTITLDNPPGYSTSANRQSLNWYGIADVLFTTSILTNVKMYQLLKPNTSSRNVYLQSIVEAQSSSSDNSIEIFDKVFRYLSNNNEITSSFIRCIGPRRIIRDILMPIVVVEAAKKQQGSYQDETRLSTLLDNDDIDEECDVNDSRCNNTKLHLNRILQVLTAYLILPHSIEMLNCAELSTTLWCFAQIYSDEAEDDWFDEQHDPFQLGDDQISLIRSFMKRLRKVTVHSMGSGKDIARAIWSVDRLVMSTNRLNIPGKLTEMWDMNELELPIDFFSEESDPTANFDKINQAQLEIDENNISTQVDKLREETVIMFYTLSKELLKTDNNASSYCKLKSLSLEQLADVLQAGISLKIPRSDLSMLAVTAVSSLTTTSKTWQSNNIISQCSSCVQISRLLWAFQRLRVGNGEFDNSSTSSAIQHLGDRFRELVVCEEDKYIQKCTPKTLTITLRSAVMMFPGDSRATKAILEAASHLILGGPEHNGAHTTSGPYIFDSPSFLMKCNEYELSNFLFAFANAKCYDEAILNELTAQMLESDIIESCTASSASRAMWSCAVLLQQIPADSDESFVHERQIDLYHQLPGVLLSSQLTSTDCSCAMWAMAKTGYALDKVSDFPPILSFLTLEPMSNRDSYPCLFLNKGCFDYLARTLSRSIETSQVSTRLVAQALWACGKMIRYDQHVIRQSNRQSPNIQNAPYMESVVKFLRYLIKNNQQMTPLHISQAVWAMGSLRVFDPIIAGELTDIAMENVALFNSQETSNIVWGLSKINFNKPEMVLRLVSHATESELIDSCTSQEASNMLYALGKLQIQDAQTFERLSDILMSKLQSASSQAIANALWAFDAVELEPPIELIGGWAREKLGMEDVA